MPQVTVHIPNESTEPNAAKKKLTTDILSKHGLSLSQMHPNTPAAALQSFNLVAVPDIQTAKDIVDELQSNGISAFLKPQASAP
jgi:hypothetical protein